MSLSERDLNAVLSTIDLASQNQLRTILDKVETKLAAGSQQDQTMGLLYNRFRDSLVHRFLPVQLANKFKPWKLLPKQSRLRFMKAWNVVLEFLSSHYNMQHTATREAAITLTIKVVSCSPFYDAGPSFENLLKSMNAVKDLFENSFPGYGREGLNHVLEIMIK